MSGKGQGGGGACGERHLLGGIVRRRVRRIGRGGHGRGGMASVHLGRRRRATGAGTVLACELDQDRVLDRVWRVVHANVLVLVPEEFFA